MKFQVPAVYGDLSVRQNVHIPLQREIGGRRIDAAIEETLDEFGRLDAADTRAGDLSHGQQQWLEIAMASALDPDLLDEPSEGIQPSIVQQLADDIARMNDELGVTVLFVEQNLQVIRELAERCYVVDGGRIEAQLDDADLEDADAVAEYLAV